MGATDRRQGENFADIGGGLSQRVSNCVAERPCNPVGIAYVVPCRPLMVPSRRLPRGLPRLPGLLPALLIASALVLPSAQAALAAQAGKSTKPAKSAPSTRSAKSTQSTKAAKASKAPKAPKATKGQKASAASKATSSAARPAPPATLAVPGSADTEAADIDDFRRRLATRTLIPMRRAEVDDVAIEVWSSPEPRRFYVAVSQQGAVRRTLASADESTAWGHFDSFRRMAAAGDVGRPVLLGRMVDEPMPTPTPPPPVPFTPAIAPATTPPILSPAPLLPAVPMTALSDVADPDLRFFGSAVETVRRRRFGDEVARLVWSAETQEYFAALTRQGTVLLMVRSRDAADADRAYEQFVRQAEARASLRFEPADAAPAVTALPAR